MRVEGAVVYLAGKITGDPNYRTKFAKAAKKLEGLDYIVLNPATLPGGMEHEAYMRIDAAMLKESDMICLLPDWKESPGARQEHNLAKAMNKFIMFYPGDDGKVAD